ncbi:hypothetical protein [Foetidibacter luteolus]|uniref:hypothetical protein n=1 Tax=Foetidibacter luteolus TaxID=2608880 RepID=UPI00129B4EC1|nr:hypothetical protein [Foetidibacter luteolus]
MNIRLIISKIFTVIVALQILNLSIYNSEFEPLPVTNTTTTGFDETDSFVELIAENVAEKNLDKNGGEDKNKQSQVNKDFQVKFFPPDETGSLLLQPVSDVEQNNHPAINYSYLFYKKFNRPPAASSGNC